MEEIFGDHDGINVRQPFSSVVSNTNRDLQKQEEEVVVVKGVRSTSAPPPFLTKTYKMVEDPHTNYIISWSSSGTSLIILDHLKFAAEVLPSYFKHSNFSSFLYQLNNYGFKKIGLRQYEYENKWFQAGREDLLINIKRRSDEDSTKQGRISKRHCFGAVEKYGMEADMEKVIYNVNSSKVEIPKLKGELGHLESCIATFKQNVEEMEIKSNKMMVFLGRVFSPALVDNIIERVEEEEDLVKRRKLMEVGPENSAGKNQADDHEWSSPPNESIPAENNESKECDPYKIIVGDDDDDSESENINESEREIAEQHSRFDMGLDDDMMAVAANKNVVVREVVQHLDDQEEVTFELWA